MELEIVVRDLDIVDSEEILRVNWVVSQNAMPDGGILSLSPQYIQWACEIAHLPKNMSAAVIKAVERIADDDALRALAWHCHYNLFQSRGENVPVRDWPLLTSALDRDAGMFYVVVLLSGTTQMQEVHRRRGIPEDIVRDTVGDLELCMNKEDFREDFSHWGISPRILSWLLLHWRGDLYCLGRLQFVPDKCRARLCAFRHRANGTVIALSEMGMQYRSDGQVDGAGGVFDKERAWTSFLSITSDQVVGSPIAPTGHAVEKQVRLRSDEWRQDLSPGDPVLAIHIPAGSPMDYEECGKSIQKALEFFPKYFPDRPFVALMCHSWILDAQFEQLLPPTSNLVRFQKEMYLFPIKGGSEGTLKSVFGRHMTDIRKAPRKTTMQRAFAQHIENGGHFRSGGCFLFPKDFNWGSQFYRTQKLPFLNASS